MPLLLDRHLGQVRVVVFDVHHPEQIQFVPRNGSKVEADPDTAFSAALGHRRNDDDEAFFGVQVNNVTLCPPRAIEDLHDVGGWDDELARRCEHQPFGIVCSQRTNGNKHVEEVYGPLATIVRLVFVHSSEETFTAAE